MRHRSYTAGFNRVMTLLAAAHCTMYDTGWRLCEIRTVYIIPNERGRNVHFLVQQQLIDRTPPIVRFDLATGWPVLPCSDQLTVSAFSVKNKHHVTRVREIFTT